MDVLSLVGRDLLSSRHADFHPFAHLFKVISFRILSIRRPPCSSSSPPVRRRGIYFLLQIDRRPPLYLCSLKVNSIPSSISLFFNREGGRFCSFPQGPLLSFSVTSLYIYPVTHTHTHPHPGECGVTWLLSGSTGADGIKGKGC